MEKPVRGMRICVPADYASPDAVAMNSCRSLLLDWWRVGSAGLGLAGLARRATYFLCFAKESKQRKATLLSATPSLCYGAPCGTRFKRGPRKLASLRQRAALIRLKLRSSAQTEGGKECECGSPYDSFSLWEKAGMRASGGRAPAGSCLQADKTRLQLFTGANSESPHPSLLPGGQGGIPKAPSAISPLVSCLSPHPSWLGL